LVADLRLGTCGALYFVILTETRVNFTPRFVLVNFSSQRPPNSNLGKHLSFREKNWGQNNADMD